MAQYSDDFIDRQHLIWGPGFLSPGGPEEVAEIEGPLRDQIIEVCDPETHKNWLAVRRALAAAAKSGGLRPTHLRGYRPMSIG